MQKHTVLQLCSAVFPIGAVVCGDDRPHPEYIAMLRVPICLPGGRPLQRFMMKNIARKAEIEVAA